MLLKKSKYLKNKSFRFPDTHENKKGKNLQHFSVFGESENNDKRKSFSI
jgi:hypothetical protein